MRRPPPRDLPGRRPGRAHGDVRRAARAAPWPLRPPHAIACAHGSPGPGRGAACRARANTSSSSIRASTPWRASPCPRAGATSRAGIPLSSSTGDAIEFVGTREYREGDPVREHPLAVLGPARRTGGEGVPGGVLRAHRARPRHLRAGEPTPAEERSFEAAISVLASIADHYSRSDFVVDILAAGPEVYEVSAGRSLAYLDNILDVLAGL